MSNLNTQYFSIKDFEKKTFNECQLSARLQVLWSQAQTPASPKLGLVVTSCNTATGGQQYLDVDGAPASYPCSKDGSGAGLQGTVKKRLPP